MDGVATPIIGRPRPLPGHDTPNPAYHPHTLNYEEPDKGGGSTPTPAEVQQYLDGLVDYGAIQLDDSYVYRGVDEKAAGSAYATNAHIGTSPAYHRK